MFELLFIIGVVAWMFELLCEYLSALPVFPTLLTALLAIPALTYFDYYFALERQFLGGVNQDRAPVPPEVFRWRLARPRWRRQIIWSACLLPVGWLPIFWFPAQWDFGLSSVAGWVFGLIAIFSTSLLISRLSLYFRVAQWFDQMTPRIAGWFWQTLYRFSDTTDYLPEKKEPEKDKAIF